jgi:hypothetical protein
LVFPRRAAPASKERLIRHALATALVLASASARADVVVIVRDAAAPEGLEDHLRLTIAAWLGDSRHGVTVSIEDGLATIDVDGRRRAVAVGDWSDPETIRRLVVHVVDLDARFELAPLAVERPVRVVERVVEPGVGPAPAQRGAVAVATRLGHGLARSNPWTLGVAGELGLAAPRWRVAVGLGWTHGLVHRAGKPDEGRYDAWPVSVIAGLRVGPVELSGRTTVAPSHLSGALTQNPVRIGAAAAVRWHAGGGLAVDLGVESWVRNTAVTIAGAAVFSTPAIEPYVALGFAWGGP